MNKFVRIFILALAAVACGGFARADDGPARVSGVDALKERLKALEAEEAAMEKLVDKLAAGEPIEDGEFWDAWVPPAVYPSPAVDETEETEIPLAAIEVAQGILTEKEEEMKALEAIRGRIERGEEIGSDAIEHLGDMGLEEKERTLEAQTAEVDALRQRLEELQFENRVRKAADLDAPLEQEAIPGVPEVRDGPALVEAEGADEEETPRIVTDPLVLAESCYRAGRYDKARRVLEALDRASSAEGDRILYLIGRCREKLGDLKGARLSYDELGKAYPDSFWAKESRFARSMIDWKEEMGPIEGVPEEVYAIIGRGPAESKAEGDSHDG